eukprot:TRINITY_DN24774_c0_g1_i1.p1 TRINITY_DN24774_c0_g1~~TRINITY_DN24774_c0_g1_i1.p1  ORF type:complete len:286 (-),score=37.28 TRINITY_DN24774_c0_g1_i1:45-902(-)
MSVSSPRRSRSPRRASENDRDDGGSATGALSSADRGIATALPIGRLSGRAVLLPLSADDSRLEDLRRDRGYGSKSNGLCDTLLLSLEEALFLLHELAAITVIVDHDLAECTRACADVADVVVSSADASVEATLGSVEARDSLPSTLAGDVLAPTPLDRSSAGRFYRVCCSRIPNFARRYAAYRHLRLAGWVVRLASVKFGGDFMLYEGRVDDVHARYTVILDHVGLLWSDAVANSRLATLVNKEVLIVFFLAWPEATEFELDELLNSPATRPTEVVVRRWAAHQG